MELARKLAGRDVLLEDSIKRLIKTPPMLNLYREIPQSDDDVCMFILIPPLQNWWMFSWGLHLRECSTAITLFFLEGDLLKLMLISTLSVRNWLKNNQMKMKMEEGRETFESERREEGDTLVCEGVLYISVNKKRLGIDISLFATGAPCRAGRNSFKSSSCWRVVSAVSETNTSKILCVAQYVYTQIVPQLLVWLLWMQKICRVVFAVYKLYNFTQSGV